MISNNKERRRWKREEAADALEELRQAGLHRDDCLCAAVSWTYDGGVICFQKRSASADTLPKGRDAKQGSVRSKGSATAKPGRPKTVEQLARDGAE